jgi:ubiquinone/menaquinone biosynthesis C-methylase UbiE
MDMRYFCPSDGMDYVSSGFPEVDRSENANFFFTCLETLNSLPFFEDYKKESFRILHVAQGSKVLDVGCGLGIDAISMGRMVGRSGRVVGLDVSRAIIAEARRRLEGLSLPVEFVLGDARRLEFRDETFDCTRVDRSLQHISDPAQALAEMFRVTRSGGRMMAFEPDWGTFAVSSSNRQLTRKVLSLFCDNFRSGWIGRYLYSLFRKCGIEEISVDPKVLMITDFRLGDTVWDLTRNAYHAQSLGLISKKNADDWLCELRSLDAEGRFFACHSCFLVSGRRP